MSESRKICKGMNLESELNKLGMLKEILNNTRQDIGLTASQSISSDIFIRRMGEMILEYANNGKIDSRKTQRLITQHHEPQATLILGRAAVCLLEKYGLIKGGPRMC